MTSRWRPLSVALFGVTLLGAAKADAETLQGTMVYMADAALFTFCTSGRSLPIAMEGDYLELERAYLATVETPGGELFVTLEGSIQDRPKMEGDGTEPQIVVDRYLTISADEECPAMAASPLLLDTPWRITQLGETILDLDQLPVGMTPKEPQLILSAENSRFSATVGCNQLAGGYQLDGNALTFTQPMTTLMACPPPLDQWERDLATVLDQTATWQIERDILSLYADNQQKIAELEATSSR